MSRWQGTTRTELHPSLRELLHTLDRCPATLTLDLICSSARLQLNCSANTPSTIGYDLDNLQQYFCLADVFVSSMVAGKGAAVNPLSVDNSKSPVVAGTVPLPLDNGKCPVAVDVVSLPLGNSEAPGMVDAVLGVTETTSVKHENSSAKDEQGPFHESMEESSAGHGLTLVNNISGVPVTSAPATFKQDATQGTQQGSQTNSDQHLESRPYRPVRFPDFGSVFVEQLREYERDAATTNTREEAPPQPKRSLMWWLWGLVQLVPPCLVKTLLLDLHYDTIPRIYGKLAFLVQTTLWVWTSMTSFTFYASSWMPIGRVLQEDKDKVGKEGPAYWHECKKCGLSVPDIARHCSVCNVCVWERDHHCMVTGTCVGRNNAEAFKVLYILSAIGGLMYLLVVMGEAWMHQVELKPWEWFHGVISVCFLFVFTNVFFQLNKRRRHIQEKYPLFYNNEGELAHL